MTAGTRRAAQTSYEETVWARKRISASASAASSNGHPSDVVGCFRVSILDLLQPFYCKAVVRLVKLRASATGTAKSENR